MLNRTSMSETVAQPADRAPSSDRTTLQLARDETDSTAFRRKAIVRCLAATAAILIFAPLLAVLALVVRLAIGAPILFKAATPRPAWSPLRDLQIPHHD